MEQTYTYIDAIFKEEAVKPFAMKCKGDCVTEVFEGITRLAPDVVSFSVSTQPQNHPYIEVSDVADMLPWFTSVLHYDYYVQTLHELENNGTAKM